VGGEGEGVGGETEREGKYTLTKCCHTLLKRVSFSVMCPEGIKQSRTLRCKGWGRR